MTDKATPPLPPATILVVDDSPANLKLLADTLAMEGYQVRPADSGDLALTAVAANPPDLILLDISMPGLAGFEVFRRLKAHDQTQRIPVIFLSATTDMNRAVEGLHLGAEDYISKPFQADDLLARVKTHVTLSRTRLLLEHQAAALRQTNRALRMISDCNQELVRATNESALLQGICRIAVECGGYRMVWVGFAEQDEARTVRPVVRFGFEAGYLDKANITWADTERGRGPIGTAIRTGQPVIMSDILTNPAFTPWRAAAAERGYKSCIALPLKNGDRTFGALSFYAAEVRALDTEEVKLLEELVGNLAYGIAALRQRAERTQAERALKESEERFRTLFEAMAEGLVLHEIVWENDAPGRAVDYRIIDCNPAFERQTGLSAAAAKGRLGSEFYGTSPAPYLDIYARVAQTTKPHTFETFFPPLQRHFLVSVFAPKQGCFATVFSDITERIRSEKALRESEERFRTLVEQAIDGVELLDQRGRYLDANTATCRELGYSKAELLALSVPDVDPNVSLDKYQENFHAIADKSVVTFETTHRRKNGSEFPVEISASIIEMQCGRCCLALVRNVTERKRMEASLLRSQRMESVGTLASGVAHDLNNILAPILMSLPMLRHRSDPEDFDETVNLIESNVNRGAQIVKQLLTFARGLGGERVDIQLWHLVRELNNITRETFPKNIVLDFRKPLDLWIVHGDPTQMHQLLLNLCLNARDAMPLGGTLRLELENRLLNKDFVDSNPDAKVGPHVCIRISDTGTGISPENMNRIFDPFFTTKEIGKGTGLGLATALGIVKHHEGFIKVNSTVGQGTAFEVFLPAKPGQAIAPLQVAAPKLPRGQGETILLVDDEAPIRNITQQILSSKGYHVLSAADGIEATKLYEQNRDAISLVLCDYMMPKLDGLQLARALHRINPGVQIILSSGVTEALTDAVIAEFQVCGVTQQIVKPYAADVLLNMLHRILHPPSATTEAGMDKPRSIF